jgi:hypothetical protein
MQYEKIFLPWILFTIGREYFSLIVIFDLTYLSVWTLCLALLVSIQLKVYDNFDTEYMSRICSLYIIDSMEPI